MIPPALIAILIAGVALRLINLSGRPLWYDEAFAMLYSRLPYDSMIEVPDLQHPPFYYLSLKSWTMISGESAAGARSLSLMYGAATIGLAYLLMREMFDRRIGLIAACFVALSPFQIAFSQEARMYAQLGFWSTASVWAFVRGARTNSLWAWIAFGVCGAATLYSHNLALAFFAAVGIFVLLRLATGLLRRVLRVALLSGTLTAALIMGVLFGPWLTRLMGQFGEIVQVYRIAPPTAATFAQTMIAFGFWTDNQAARLPLAAAMLAGSILIVALIAREMIRRRREFDARVGLLLTLFLAPIIVVALVSYALRPVYIIRGLIPSQIAFLLLAAWAAARLPRVVQIGAGALIGLVWILALASHYPYTGFPRAPWPDIAAYLRVDAKGGDAIVHDNRLTFFPMIIVDPALEQVYLPDAAGIGVDILPQTTQEALGLPWTRLDDAIAGRDRVWLVIFTRTRDDYRAAGFADDPNWVALDAHFNVVEQRSFGDLAVFLFNRAD